MAPVFIKEMNTTIFIISGLISLTFTVLLITFIYRSSLARAEISIAKQFRIVFILYAIINVFYFTNLIPPVPLALHFGYGSTQRAKENNSYLVTYEQDEWYILASQN